MHLAKRAYFMFSPTPPHPTPSHPIPPHPTPRPQSLKDKLKSAREELLDARGKLEIEGKARAAAEAREGAQDAERREAAVRVREEREEADRLRKALEVRGGGGAFAVAGGGLM